MMLAQAKSLAMTPAEVGDRWEVADNMGGFMVRVPLPYTPSERRVASPRAGQIKHMHSFARHSSVATQLFQRRRHLHLHRRRGTTARCEMDMVFEIRCGVCVCLKLL
jgi:hypothetical protein